MRIVALVVAAAALAACGASASTRAQPGAEQDVRLLERQMQSLHPNLFHDLSRETFAAAADELARRAPELTPDEFLVGLMRIAALPGVRDGHTGIFPLDPSHRAPLHVFPIRLYDFPEGLHVVAEARPLGLVGARVTAVAGVPIAEVVARVRPLVPRDNDSSLRARLPQYALSAEVLAGLGIVDGVGPTAFTVVGSDGATREVMLEPIAAPGYSAAFADLFHPMIPDGLPYRPAPAYLANRRRSTWTTTLDRGRVAYLAYNVTLVDTAPLRRWVLRRAARRDFRRLVVDLRHNPGGDNTTYHELLQALRSPRVNRRGRLVVLLSRTTFSAAANFATELDRRTRAVFVGEASGGSPNLYGDAAAVPLPVTGLTAHVAEIYWEVGGRGDRRLAIEPEVRIDLSAADFFGGRDPVLAAALALR